MIKYLIILFLSIFGTQAVPLDAKFLNSVHMVETGGRLGAIVGDNGAALGPYQIHRVYWADAVQYDKTIGGKYEDVTNKAYAEKIITAYMNRYARKAILANDFETLARVHNGGPKGASKSATLGYWRKVQKTIDRPLTP